MTRGHLPPGGVQPLHGEGLGHIGAGAEVHGGVDPGELGGGEDLRHLAAGHIVLARPVRGEEEHLVTHLGGGDCHGPHQLLQEVPQLAQVGLVAAV